MLLLRLVLLSASVFSLIAAQTSFYVDSLSGVDKGNCTDPAQPCASPYFALAALGSSCSAGQSGSSPCYLEATGSFVPGAFYLGFDHPPYIVMKGANADGTKTTFQGFFVNKQETSGELLLENLLFIETNVSAQGAVSMNGIEMRNADISSYGSNLTIANSSLTDTTINSLQGNNQYYAYHTIVHITQVSIRFSIDTPSQRSINAMMSLYVYGSKSTSGEILVEDVSLLCDGPLTFPQSTAILGASLGHVILNNFTIAGCDTAYTLQVYSDQGDLYLDIMNLNLLQELPSLTQSPSHPLSVSPHRGDDFTYGLVASASGSGGNGLYVTAKNVLARGFFSALELDGGKHSVTNFTCEESLTCLSVGVSWNDEFVLDLSDSHLHGASEGLHIYSAELTLDNSVFEECSLLNVNGKYGSISNSVFSGCESSSDPPLKLSRGDYKLNNVTFLDNTNKKGKPANLQCTAATVEAEDIYTESEKDIGFTCDFQCTIEVDGEKWC